MEALFLKGRSHCRLDTWKLSIAKSHLEDDDDASSAVQLSLLLAAPIESLQFLDSKNTLGQRMDQKLAPSQVEGPLLLPVYIC
jgi:hypothetical protein